MPLIEARKPWFCISIADFTPARCAPIEMPTPSSSFASRTSVIVGIVVGQSDQVHEPCLGQRRHQAHAARLERVEDDLELAAETGMGRDVIAPRL